jgi:hypothetical protein
MLGSAADAKANRSRTDPFYRGYRPWHRWVRCDAAVFRKVAYSEPADLTVVFRQSGTKLQNVPIDVSKDKAFETYDAAGRRVSTFGGYGAIEGNYINGFDVHPTQPWAVTTASQVTLPDGRAAGMVTIWDLPTGRPLQRLETATQIGNPMISVDGELLMANAGNGINIFRVV